MIRQVVIPIIDIPDEHPNETAFLTEAALSDWNRPEEDIAWEYLQLVVKA